MQVTFGKRVEGYSVAVLNEREIRGAAGILLLLMSASLAQVLFRSNFLPIKFVITFFLIDLSIRVFINPAYAPSMLMARWIVRGQIPEYVGAPQKRFAWKMGIGISGTMFVLLVLLNSYGVAASLLCYTCLLFLFFETAFGICLGCLVYRWFYKEQPRHCAGEICNSTKQ